MLCLTATMLQAAEKKVIRHLGVKTSYHKIQMSPISPRISFHNRDGVLNVRHIAEMLIKFEASCPRILIFEQSLVSCGSRFLELARVSYLKEYCNLPVLLTFSTQRKVGTQFCSYATKISLKMKLKLTKINIGKKLEKI